jgi:hypothetical protein
LFVVVSEKSAPQDQSQEKREIDPGDNPKNGLYGIPTNLIATMCSHFLAFDHNQQGARRIQRMNLANRQQPNKNTHQHTTTAST